MFVIGVDHHNEGHKSAPLMFSCATFLGGYTNTSQVNWRKFSNSLNITWNTHLKFTFSLLHYLFPTKKKKKQNKVGLPSLLAFWALQTIGNPRPLWVIGATEEDDNNNDDEMERVLVLNPFLLVGNLNLFLEGKAGKWAWSRHPLLLGEMVLTWTMPSIGLSLSLSLVVRRKKVL